MVKSLEKWLQEPPKRYRHSVPLIPLRDSGIAHYYLTNQAFGFKFPCPLERIPLIGGAVDSHQAVRQIEDGPSDDTRNRQMERPAPPYTDPLWPHVCRCGYEFPTPHFMLPEDSHADEVCFPNQRLETIRIREDTGEKVTVSTAPAGAIWDAPFCREAYGWQGPDGQTLTLKLPSAVVSTDWPFDFGLDDPDYHQYGLGEDARAYRGWQTNTYQRTGSIKTLTVTPEIQFTYSVGGGGSNAQDDDDDVVQMWGWCGVIRKGRVYWYEKRLDDLPRSWRSFGRLEQAPPDAPVARRLVDSVFGGGE